MAVFITPGEGGTLNSNHPSASCSRLLGCARYGYSAKVLVSDQPNVSYICSRYYRAPELCLGVPRYTHAIGERSRLVSSTTVECHAANVLDPGVR